MKVDQRMSWHKIELNVPGRYVPYMTYTVNEISSKFDAKSNGNAPFRAINSLGS